MADFLITYVNERIEKLRQDREIYKDTKMFRDINQRIYELEILLEYNQGYLDAQQK